MSSKHTPHPFFVSHHQQVTGFLTNLIPNTLLHARWLNTLAFLEHIGSRKIIKSQNSSRLSLHTLQHISEEARHSVHFKKLSLKTHPTAGATFHPSHTLAGPRAEQYFQNLDHQAAQTLHPLPQKNTLNYLYTTLLVEERALEVYTLYNNILKQQGKNLPLQLVLQEEAGHLKEITGAIQKKDPDHKTHTKKLFEYEGKEFHNLLQEWTSLI